MHDEGRGSGSSFVKFHSVQTNNIYGQPYSIYIVVKTEKFDSDDDSSLKLVDKCSYIKWPKNISLHCIRS